MKRAAHQLEELPNIGPRIAEDLRRLEIRKPADLKGRDPVRMYRALEQHTGRRQDPCVLDTFMAVVDHANGAPAHPW